MAMTAQEWQEIELRHAWRELESRDVREVEREPHPARPRKRMDPMIYLTILAIVGVIGTLVMFFYAIRTANHHPPHRDSINMMYRPQEE